MRFLYFYLMKDAPDRAQATAPQHAAYWRELGLRDFLGGPFGDRSGGSITFQSDSGAEAERLVAGDPFLREGLLERHWVKEWSPIGALCGEHRPHDRARREGQTAPGGAPWRASPAPAQPQVPGFRK